jgi:hypothetical protein
MPGRAVAQQVFTASTSTGVSATAYFGTGHYRVSALIENPSTKSFSGRIEVGMGNSTAWFSVTSIATSTGNVLRTSTGGVVFDKARFLTDTNSTTGGVNVWLLAAV